MHLETAAIVVAVRAHGEHGAIVRALTPEDGIQAGYVRGGKSRRLRPVLVPGNAVQADYRARTEDQLPHLTVELAHSRAFLLSEPLASAGIEWATALTAAALPEGQAYPRVYQGLDGVLAAIEAAPSARGWAAALVRYELLVLGELGFGLGEEDMAAWPDTILGRLKLLGRHLARDLLTDRQAEVLAARERLVERLKRMAG
ncbi:MAG TPA: recombination protein O N-terminal domain-containing protein [Allosphingosinicella sp.]|nr:recombination protein O N-terminal domain-containing protein [Allosphingosinicella sp.]